MSATILIVDDEHAARHSMKRALGTEDYRLLEAGDADEARKALDGQGVDLVLCDINMPGTTGIELLRAAQSRPPCPPFIMITAYGSEKLAVEAWKQGARGYVTKPYDVDELRLVVREALDKERLTREVKELSEIIEAKQVYGEIIGDSAPKRKVYDRIDKVAPADVTVLVRGESGTGKELVAREIHLRSRRAKGVFEAINCAALPENLMESALFGHEKGAFTSAYERQDGLFKVADGGTLFLDEIGDMNLACQAKLLRVLEERCFSPVGGHQRIPTDVRLVSATNQDLEAAIRAGRFREDLYYRIKVVEIVLPPLRQRRSDIETLATYFARKFATVHHKKLEGIAPGCAQRMLRHDWPGNVRELRNVIESAVIMASGPTLEAADLPPEFAGGSESVEFLRTAPEESEGKSFQEVKKAYVETFERRYITRKLAEFGGNVSRTAEALGMHRQSLQQKMRELGINRDEFKGG